jgi:hypothetical protein
MQVSSTPEHNSAAAAAKRQSVSIGFPRIIGDFSRAK